MGLIWLIPHFAGILLLGFLGAVMSVDLAATVATIIKLNRRLAQIDELAAKIKEASNEFGENLADKVLDAVERTSEWKEEQNERRAQAKLQLEEWRAAMQELLEHESFGHRRLLRAFPRLRSIDHNSALERLHHHMVHLKKH